jgi:hypothetical protein
MMKIGPMKWPPPVFLKKRGTDLSAVNQIANEKELEAARLSVCTRFFRKTDTALSRSFQKPKSPILKRTRRWQWLKKCLLRRKLSNGSDYFPHR